MSIKVRSKFLMPPQLPLYCPSYSVSVFRAVLLMKSHRNFLSYSSASSSKESLVLSTSYMALPRSLAFFPFSMILLRLRPEMVVGWYHSHPGFGFWRSGVDINTQHSFEPLNQRAVAQLKENE
ncbi:JAB1/Mov34/MPN/PAD-1 ubiquitin protease [Arabidopsis thaliana]|uniref:JAB1/Mov34/MPN/PAD-1 ubiquitin protease n=1 Tax=Arabidopsis thaliana TaxID=3702 RepID=A0A1P8BGX5_ARATH|nr:JAB1/Mov34/MPN/PAD-1 ubiquitin protease [Arabidopsis thaliana]ANM70797.1 JAB1/Mov34/MPN/PAD-1 ubiquitin protease [Arabidopsis thaliana]|eukprot:NP_001332378.1 JAB1/Mov34/MPN/PAD-1 ubiquitin protease [Arabidopsis thaliana]